MGKRASYGCEKILIKRTMLDNHKLHVARWQCAQGLGDIGFGRPNVEGETKDVRVYESAGALQWTLNCGGMSAREVRQRAPVRR